MRKKTGIKLAVVGALAFSGVFASIVPANAAGMNCYTPSDNGTQATGVCIGINAGYVQLNVSCPAIWPWTPWIDYGPWVWVNGSMYLTNSHISCGLPVSLSYQTR